MGINLLKVVIDFRLELTEIFHDIVKLILDDVDDLPFISKLWLDVAGLSESKLVECFFLNGVYIFSDVEPTNFELDGHHFASEFDLVNEAGKKLIVDRSIFISTVCNQGFNQVELFEWCQVHRIELLGAFLVSDEFIISQVIEDDLLDLTRNFKFSLKAFIDFDKVDSGSSFILWLFSVLLENLFLAPFEYFYSFWSDQYLIYFVIGIIADSVEVVKEDERVH